MSVCIQCERRILYEHKVYSLIIPYYYHGRIFSLNAVDLLNSNVPKDSMVIPCGSAGKESACDAADPVLGMGKCPGEGKGYQLQYSGLENSMDCIATRLQRVGHDWLTFTSLLIFRERKIKTRVFIKLLDFKRSVPKDVGNLVSSG